MHPLNCLLVVRLSLVDGSNDVFTIGSRKRDIGKLLVQCELDVAGLEVVVVDLDGA